MMRRLIIALFLSVLAIATFDYGDASTTVISPLPVQHFADNNGNPCVGCKLFTYAAGTVTKQTSYTNFGGATPNTNPIILNARGEAFVWLNPTLAYKFVLSPATDTDPPTNPFWTVDNLNSSGSNSIAYGTGTTVTTSSLIAAGTVTICVNASAANTQTLPALPTFWEIHTIKDCAGNAHTDPITLSGNGNNIDQFGTSTPPLAVNGISITVQWNGSAWMLE